MYHITAILLIVTYLPPSSVILRTFSFILQKNKQEQMAGLKGADGCTGGLKGVEGGHGGLWLILDKLGHW